MTNEKPNSPPLWRWASELLAVPKIIAAPYRSPDRLVPFGDGRPALVIPGMLSGDRSTSLLRRSLDKAGFVSSGWGGQFNARVSEETLAKVEARLLEVTTKAGLPAIIIGWSLGGFYARVLAQRRPEVVSMVVTLGTPFSGDRHANRAWRLYELINDHTVDNPPFAEDPSVKPPQRTLAFWSRTDGIVSPEASRGTSADRDEAYELPASHFAMGTSKGAIRQIIEILRSELAD